MSATTRALRQPLHLSRALRRRQHHRRRQPRSHRKPRRGGNDVATDEIEGYNDTGGFCGTRSPYKVYFVARFSKPSASRGTWSGTAIGPTTRRTGWDIGAYVSFATKAGEAIEVRLGLSYVSIANARANLDAEIPDARTFQQVRAAALARWNADLGRIDVTGGTAEQKKIFYTALYHALIHPSVNSDVNGQYQGMKSTGVRVANGYTHYHLFSLWDTYRSLHPLLSLLYPERQGGHGPLDDRHVQGKRLAAQVGARQPRDEHHGGRSGLDRHRRHLPEGHQEL